MTDTARKPESVSAAIRTRTTIIEEARAALEEGLAPADAMVTIVAKMRAEDADGWLAYLESRGDVLVLQEIKSVQKEHRGTRVSEGSGIRGSQLQPARFQEAVRVAGEGNVAPLGEFRILDAEHFVGAGPAKALRDMTSADLLKVAAGYQESAERRSLMAAYYRQLSRMVPKGKTLGDVMDEHQAKIAFERATHTNLIELPRAID